MTKKDYEAIAKAFRVVKRYNLHEENAKVYTDMNVAFNRLATELSDHLRQDNPRFDIDRFTEACGLETDMLYWTRQNIPQ